MHAHSHIGTCARRFMTVCVNSRAWKHLCTLLPMQMTRHSTVVVRVYPVFLSICLSVRTIQNREFRNKTCAHTHICVQHVAARGVCEITFVVACLVCLLCIYTHVCIYTWCARIPSTHRRLTSLRNNTRRWCPGTHNWSCAATCPSCSPKAAPARKLGKPWSLDTYEHMLSCMQYAFMFMQQLAHVAIWRQYLWGTLVSY
jgi:hypothetical protein